MNREEAISFYVASTKSRLRQGEPNRCGWQRCVVYRGRHMPKDLGCGGSSMQFFKLSDGRILQTNDLWDDTSDGGWVASVPAGGLIGHRLETRVCQLKTKEAISALVKLVTSTWAGSAYSGFEIKENLLSSKEAYELPTATMRKYQGNNDSSSFASCEGITLSHIKVGGNSLEALTKLSQLAGANPEEEPVFVLYNKTSVLASDFGLQKGDPVDECFVYDEPEWTDGRYSSAAVETRVRPGMGSYSSADSYYDFAYEEDSRYEFTPHSGYYSTGGGDIVYAMAGEEPDYTACDKECGYCGRCQY